LLGLVAAWFVGQQQYYLSLCGAVLCMAAFFAEVLNRHRQRGGARSSPGTTTGSGSTAGKGTIAKPLDRISPDDRDQDQSLPPQSLRLDEGDAAVLKVASAASQGDETHSTALR
jgi:hypothetical protein